MSKRVMILGANELLLPLILKCKGMGHTAIVVSPNLNEPGHRIADVSVCLNLLNKQDVLKSAKELKIDGIITDQAETPIRTVAYVAEQLGLPGIGLDKAELFTNKYRQRLRCEEIGISNIRFKLVNNCEDAVSFFESLGCEAIMKPIDSAGSRGVKRISCVEDIRNNFEYTKKASRTEQVIIEQFIDGKEILLDGVCINGHYQTLVCGEYHNAKGLFSSFLTSWPADISEKQMTEANLFAKRLIEGFGLSWGRTHTELKINNNGVWLMETAARGGGRFISSTVIPTMTDFSSEEFLINSCLGVPTKDRTIIHRNRKCAYVSMFLPKGEIVSIQGLEEILNKPWVSANNLGELRVGMKTNSYHDKTEARFMHFYAENQKDFDERLTEIRKTLIIVVKTKNGYEGIDWGL